MEDGAKLLADEHAWLSEQADRLERIGISGPADERRAVLDAVLERVHRHHTVERSVVLPTLVHELEDAAQLAAEEQEVLDRLVEATASAERTSSDDPGHDMAVRRLVDTLREHTGRWEERWLPRVEHTDEETLARLADQITRSDEIVRESRATER